MSMNDRVINATPGPNTTRENLVVVRQIEAIRVALRLFDRQLEATAKEALDSTSRTVSLDVPRKRFLEELTSIRKGHRYEKIRKEAMKFKPQKGRESSVNGETSSSFRPQQKPDGSESEAEAKKTGKHKQSAEKTPELTPFDRAQLLVDREAADARLLYEKERGALLDTLKQIREGAVPATQKPETLDKLNEVEKNYSHIWRRLESGVRGTEILESITRKSRSRNKRGRKNKKSAVAQKVSSPKTRMRRNSSMNDFQLAIRRLDQEARRQEALAAKHRELQSMVWTHPYRANSTATDRVYMTSGFRNPRAKE